MLAHREEASPSSLKLISDVPQPKCVIEDKKFYTNWVLPQLTSFNVWRRGWHTFMVSQILQLSSFNKPHWILLPTPKLLYSISCNMLLRLKFREAYAASGPLLSNMWKLLGRLFSIKKCPLMLRHNFPSGGFLKIIRSMASEARDKLLPPQSGLLSIWYFESFIHTCFYNLSIVLEKYQQTLLYIRPDFWHILFYSITEP